MTSIFTVDIECENSGDHLSGCAFLFANSKLLVNSLILGNLQELHFMGTFLNLFFVVIVTEFFVASFFRVPLLLQFFNI